MTSRMQWMLGLVGLMIAWLMLDQWQLELGSQAKQLLAQRKDAAAVEKQLVSSDWFERYDKAVKVRAQWRSLVYDGASLAQIRVAVASDMQKILQNSKLRGASYKIVERGESAEAKAPAGTQEVAVVFNAAFSSDAVPALLMLLQAHPKAMRLESLVVKGTRFEMTAVFLAKLMPLGADSVKSN
jgi:hypothetical protein